MVHEETVSFAEYYEISIDHYEDVPVTTLPFSVRVINRLMENGITTVADLLKMSPEVLMQIKGFGENCLNEVETFCAELQSKELAPASTSKTAMEPVSQLVKAHSESISLGDFSFADESPLNDEEIECLQFYKNAFSDLGEDLAFACVNSPRKIMPIIKMFNDYQYEAKLYSEVCELVAEIPSARKEKIAAGYINAFTIDEEKRCQLRSFYNVPIESDTEMAIYHDT